MLVAVLGGRGIDGHATNGILHVLHRCAGGFNHGILGYYHRTTRRGMAAFGTRMRCTQPNPNLLTNHVFMRCVRIAYPSRIEPRVSQ